MPISSPNPYNDRLPEPVPRADGTCVVCEKPIPPNAGKYGDKDAFCRRKCAQTYFGTLLAVDVDMVEPSVLSKNIQARKK